MEHLPPATRNLLHAIRILLSVPQSPQFRAELIAKQAELRQRFPPQETPPSNAPLTT